MAVGLQGTDYTPQGAYRESGAQRFGLQGQQSQYYEGQPPVATANYVAPTQPMLSDIGQWQRATGFGDSYRNFATDAVSRSGPTISTSGAQQATQYGLAGAQIASGASGYGAQQGQVVGSALGAQQQAAGQGQQNATQAQADYSRGLGAYGEGQQQLDVLRQAQSGAAPSVAQLQMREGLDEAQKAQMSAAISGGFNPASQVRAAEQGAALSRAANRDAAQLRAQEIAQARGETSAMIGAQQGAAQGLYGITSGERGLSQQDQSLALQGGELGLRGLQTGIQGTEAAARGQEIGMRGAEIYAGAERDQAMLESDQRARNDALYSQLIQMGATEEEAARQIIQQDRQNRMAEALANQESANYALGINAQLYEGQQNRAQTTAESDANRRQESAGKFNITKLLPWNWG